MQNIPESYASLQPAPAQKKERGVFFTVVLLWNTISSLIGTFVIVLGGAYIDGATQADGSMHEIHHVASRVIAALTLFQLMQLACVGGIWAWKRWALYGYFATAVLGVIGLMKIDGNIPYWSLFGIGLMVMSTFPRLQMFED